jgi:hypothetical protein
MPCTLRPCTIGKQESPDIVAEIGGVFLRVVLAVPHRPRRPVGECGRETPFVQHRIRTVAAVVRVNGSTTQADSLVGYY